MGLKNDDGRRALLGTLATLILITVATNTTASLAQPQISAEFGAGPADTGWVVFGYSATFAVATALFGGIAARIGGTRALVGGVLVLGVGSVLAAVTPSLPALIGSRLVQGFGSGAIPTLSIALIASRFEGRARAQALGVVVAAVGSGQAIGPVLGGVLLETLGWRAAVSIGVVAIPAVLVLARTQRGRQEPVRRGRIDLIGAGLVVAAALGAAFVLNRLPVLGLVPLTIVPLAVTIAACLALARLVVTVPDGFVPRRVVADPTFRRVVVLGAVGMTAYLGTVVLIPVLAARAYGLDGIRLGLVLLPMALAAAVTSPNAARIEARLGPRTATSISFAALAAGPFLVAVGSAGPGLPITLGGLALAGLGFGLLTAPLLNELTHAFSGPDQPVAIGLYNLCFFLGGATGAAVSSAIVQAGVALPGVTPGPLAGFASAEVLLSVGPLLCAAFLTVRRPRPVT